MNCVGVFFSFSFKGLKWALFHRVRVCVSIHNFNEKIQKKKKVKKKINLFKNCYKQKRKKENLSRIVCVCVCYSNEYKKKHKQPPVVVGQIVFLW